MRLSVISNVIALAAGSVASAIPTPSAVELAPRAESTALCPRFDGQNYQDANGATYSVYCYHTNNGAVIAQTGDPVNLGQCMEACDQTSGCVAGMFHMGVNECFLLSSVGDNTHNVDYNMAFKSTSGGDIAVTFSERAQTSWGQSVKLVGSVDALGSWNPDNGISLDASSYTDANPIWTGTVNLSPGQTVQYKYVKVNGDGSVTWESDPNHSYSVPDSARNNEATKSDTWQSSSSASTTTFASTVSDSVTATSTHSSMPTATCTNAPDSRNCWYGGYDVSTDFDNQFPTTGRTVTYDWTISNITMAPDGFSRQVLAVNGQFPGPVMEANWGDNVRVTIRNAMPNNGTSIHWHGVRQLNNNGQDGVPGLTECPIAPGESHTYTFQMTYVLSFPSLERC